MYSSSQNTCILFGVCLDGGFTLLFVFLSPICFLLGVILGCWALSLAPPTDEKNQKDGSHWDTDQYNSLIYMLLNIKNIGSPP
jgi:hypothetical protein